MSAIDSSGRILDPLDPEERQLLQRDPWFSASAPSLRQALVRDGVVRSVRPGSMVYCAGSEPSGLFAVLAGEVRLLHYSSTGKYAFYHILQPLHWFGGLSEFDGLDRFSDAVAWSATRLLHLGHAALQRLLADDPRLYRDLGMMICRDLRTTLDMVADAKATPPRAQTAQLLAMMSMARQGEPDCGLDLTQEQLAAMVGVSRQTMNKILQQFERRNLVRRRYGKVIALDPGMLAEAARDGQIDAV
jgi:CRP-like cAMP-binding protein